MRLYVGGAKPSVTNIPVLIGCIRGFKIASRVFDLEKASISVRGRPYCYQFFHASYLNLVSFKVTEKSIVQYMLIWYVEISKEGSG